MLSSISADRRVVRTHKALAEALMVLLRDHDWSEISVQAICDRADVARASFYAHFPNKAALLDHLFDWNLASLKAEFRAAPARDGHLKTLGWLVDHMADWQVHQRRAIQSEAGAHMFRRFKASACDLLEWELAGAGMTPDRDALVFALGGCCDSILDWLAAAQPKPAAALVGDLTRRTRAILGTGA